MPELIRAAADAFLHPGGPYLFVRIVTAAYALSAIGRLIPVRRKQVTGYRPNRTQPIAVAAVGAAVALTVTACTLTVGSGLAARTAADRAGTARTAADRAGALATGTSGLRLGVFEPGEWTSYQPVARFAAATGRDPSLVLIYSGWPEPWQAHFAAMVHAHHGEPFVQMEPVGVSLQSIADGRHDRYLKTYADQVRGYGHPVVLSFAAEMNGDWYAWGAGHTPPRVFVAAWRHIVDLFRAEHARNVTWLWTVNSVNASKVPLRPWWPGAGYVDQVGIDGYFYRPADTFHSVFGTTIVQVRGFTRKPILISETAVGPVVGPAKVADLFAGARAAGVAGLVWFDQAQHQGIYHQDWRLEDNPAILAAFRRASSLSRTARVSRSGQPPAPAPANRPRPLRPTARARSGDRRTGLGWARAALQHRREECNPVTEYDHIVVGGGTAGCVVAARLTQDAGTRVLVLEAGSSERTQAMIVPDAWPQLLGTSADWAGVTTGQAEAGPVAYPRGRALGGSGAINAMAHVRGHRAVYDGWAAVGWGFADLLPYFRRSEHAAGRDPALRGTEGPVRVAPVPEAGRHPVARAFAEALGQIGCPVTEDLSGPRQEGAAWVDLAIDGGQRVSPADAYLRPVLDRPNLTVEAGCLVTRLHVTRGRCAGVSYVRDGAPAQAQASGEVIVCAGAVGSPQLLMLSGIGPAGPLRALGIDPVADIAEVGENLQDHPIVKASYAASSPLPRSKYNHGEMYAALRSPLAGAYPDLHLFPILLPIAPAGCQPPAAGHVLVASAMTPDSRGSVKLASPDPREAPLVDPGFLRDGRDLDRLEAGLLMIRQAAASAAFSRAQTAEVWPGTDVRTRAGLRDFIRRTVDSYHHPVGTCRMGPDAGAVVDTELRVRGITGLRVADASVMPAIPNAHPAATVLAIAERAADLIGGR